MPSLATRQQSSCAPSRLISLFLLACQSSVCFPRSSLPLASFSFLPPSLSHADLDRRSTMPSPGIASDVQYRIFLSFPFMIRLQAAIIAG
eukprot:1043568-Rhodomonas_salina.3